MAVRLLTNEVVGTSFSFYSDEEIVKLSVKQITNPQVCQRPFAVFLTHTQLPPFLDS